MSAKTLNTVGLAMTMVGAGLLFFFAVQGGPAQGGAVSLILEQADEKDAAAFRRNFRRSRLGFLLVALGTGLQIWSNYR